MQLKDVLCDNVGCNQVVYAEDKWGDIAVSILNSSVE
jgi:hypothetical protein